MIMPSLRAAGLIMAAALLAATVGAEDSADPAGAPVWRDNPEPQHLLPSRNDRPLLLYFTAPWCGPCKLLEREVFAHPDGLAELDHYDLVRLDLETGAGRALADSQHVKSVPTFVLLTADGREIERITGYRSRRLLLHDLARFRSGQGTLTDLRRRLREAPGDLILQTEVGLRYHARRDLPRAAELLATGLQSAPRLPDTLAASAARALADAQGRLGDSAAAAATIEHLFARWPDHPYPRASWQLLAGHHRAAGDPLAAAAALQAAAALEPPRPAHLIEFAQAAAELGWRLEAAEAAARQAITMTGRADAQAMAALADVLLARRQYPEAMLWIRRAAESAPSEPRWQERRREIRQAAISGD